MLKSLTIQYRLYFGDASNTPKFMTLTQSPIRLDDATVPFSSLFSSLWKRQSVPSASVRSEN